VCEPEDSVVVAFRQVPDKLDPDVIADHVHEVEVWHESILAEIIKT
jgi:hypothetical protein